MKKVLTLAALTALLIFAGTNKTFAQAYQKGSNMLNVGLGIGAFGGGLGLIGSFEHGFTDAISGGAILGYSSSSESGIYSYGYRVLTIGARASYHFTELLNINNDKLDLYAGAGLAYRNYSYKDNSFLAGYNPRSSRVTPIFHAGVRYFFKENIGVWAEGGYSVAALQGGVVFKF